MEKITLENFRLIKEKYLKLLNIVDVGEDLSDEEIERLSSEFKEVFAELKKYDLSLIPFEEWDGFQFFDLGDDYIYDLAGTNANLDFSIIDISLHRTLSEDTYVAPTFVGCNIRNFPFEDCIYDENTFDEEFINSHKEYFLLGDIPEVVKARFYSGNVTIEDVVKYPEVADKIRPELLTYHLEYMYNLLGDDIKNLDVEFINATLLWSEEQLKGHEELDSAQKVMDYLYQKAREEFDNFSERNGYSPRRIYKRPDELGTEFRRRNPDIMFDKNFPKEAKEKFYRHKLDLRTYFEYEDVFNSKDIRSAFRVSDDSLAKFIGDDFEKIIADYKDAFKIIIEDSNYYYDFLSHIKDEKTFEEKKAIIDDYLEKVVSSKEENTSLDYIAAFEGKIPVEAIVKNERCANIIRTVGVDTLKALGYETVDTFKEGITKTEDLIKLEPYIQNIRKDIKKGIAIPQNLTIENLVEYGIDDLEFFSKNHSDDIEELGRLLERMPMEIIPLGVSKEIKVKFINRYGIDNLIRFDKENGGALSHYSQINQDSFLQIVARQDFDRQMEDRKYTYEEFEDVMYTIIKSLRDTNGIARLESFGDYGFIEGKFKDDHPELFLEFEDDKIQTAFYRGALTAETIKSNPELVNILKDKDISNAFPIQVLLGIDGLDSNDFGNAAINPTNQLLSEVVTREFGNEAFLDLCSKYGRLLDRHYMVIEGLPVDFALADLEAKLQENIYLAIIGNSTNYFKDLPDTFKNRYPELFIDESRFSPELIDRVYGGSLTFDDIKNNPDLAEELLNGKNINVLLNSEVYSPYNGWINRENYIYRDLLTKLDSKDLFKLIGEYGEYLKAFDPSLIEEGYNFDELNSLIRSEIERNILEKNIKYSEDAPEFFKEKHPELFLSDAAPEKLKLAYYSGYVGKEGEYKNRKSSDYFLSVNFLSENYEDCAMYLYGKSFDLISSQGMRRLGEVFSLDEIIMMADFNLDSLNQIADSSDEKVRYLKTCLDEKSLIYAQNELRESGDFSEEEIQEILGIEPTKNLIVNAGRVQYLQKVEKFRGFILDNPGLVLYYSEDKADSFNFYEYMDLKRLSNFELSRDFNKQAAEQIIATMYEYFGYGLSREIMRLPDIDPEAAEELIKSHGDRFRQVYEERYKLSGNLRVINTLFDKLEPIIGGKKQSLNVYKSINQKLEEGFDGSLIDLIQESIEENNLEIDEAKIIAVAKSAIEIATSEKMVDTQELIRNEFDYTFVETPANKKILSDMLMHIYRRSLNLYEGLDQDYIRSSLEKEFGRTKEDGSPFYSGHITSHLEDLMEITDNINRSNYGRMMNCSVVDILDAEKKKIGKGWIRKLLSLSSELTKEEVETLTKHIYGDSEYKIYTTKTVRLKDPSEKGMKEAHKLLKDISVPDMFTYEKAEKMFMGLSKPYSESFKTFFVKNMKEMMSDPKYYTIFQRMHAEFDKIIEDQHIATRFKAGSYSLDELLVELERTVFEGVKDGEYELEYRARKAGLEKRYFKDAQRVFSEMKKREYQTVPPVETKDTVLRGRILRMDDPLALFIGNITTCCQRFGEGQPGEPSMIHSATEHNGSVFIVERVDKYGNPVGSPVAQSWTWRNGNRVCFDNVEIPDTLEEQLKEEKLYDSILKIYQETAKKMIEVDKKALDQMLEAGKITQEIYDKLVIKEVTIGTGCDDLIQKISPEVRSKLERASAVAPIEALKEYETVSGRKTKPWIDSSVQLRIAQNEEQIKRSGIQAQSGEVPLRYTNIRHVISRTGREINPDIIRRMIKMNQDAGTLDTSIMQRASSRVTELFESTVQYQKAEEGLEVTISQDNDWYILTQEDNGVINVLDTFINNDASYNDREIVDLEYQKHLLKMMAMAEDKGKIIKMNLQTAKMMPMIHEFVDSGIIKVDQDVLSIGNAKLFTDTQDKLSKLLDAKNEERIVSKNIRFRDDDGRE